MKLRMVITFCFFLVCMVCFTFFVQAKGLWYEMDVEAQAAPVVILGKVESTVKHTFPNPNAWYIDADIVVEEVLKNGEGFIPSKPLATGRIVEIRKIEQGDVIPVIYETDIKDGEHVLLFLVSGHPWPKSDEERNSNVYKLFDKNAEHTAENEEKLKELVEQAKYFISERDKRFDANIRFFDILLRGEHLWAATNRGIFLFDKKTGDFVNRYTPIVDAYNSFTGESYFYGGKLASDKTGNIWLGSYTALAKFSNGSFRVFIPAKGELTGIPDMEAKEYRQQLGINEIFIDDNGIVWCKRYDDKIFTFDEKDGKWKIVDTIPDSLIGKPKIRGAYILNNGVVENQDVPLSLIWQGKEYKIPELSLGTYIGDPYIIDASDTLWVTLWSHIESFSQKKFVALGRLNLHQDKNWQIYSLKDGFAEKDISCLFADQDGILYIGGERGSLFKFDGKNFTPIPTIRDGKSILEE